jgi:hypothetical protein
MATITFTVPSKVYTRLMYEQYRKVKQGLKNIDTYKSTMNKVATYTNLTPTLIACIATVPSDGINIVPTIRTIKNVKKQTSKTALIGGICSLDYAVVKKSLLQEIQQGRLSQAEEEFLSQDSKIKVLIQTLRTTKNATVSATELKAPLFDLSNIQTSLMLGAILLGQQIDLKANGENGLFSYYETNDSTTADRNTRLCVGEYGVIDILENNNKTTIDIESQLKGMKAIWLNADNQYILALNSQGQLINPMSKYVYSPALVEGVQKSIQSTFKLLELVLTEVEDPNLKNKYIAEINNLKTQARALKLIA